MFPKRKFHDDFLEIKSDHRRFLPHIGIGVLGNGSQFLVGSSFQDQSSDFIFEMAKEMGGQNLSHFCAPIVCNPFNVTS